VNCPICLAQNHTGSIACTTCGSPLRAPAEPAHCLPVGSKLRGQAFTVGRQLGQGGFGITYQGADTSLGRPVAIKELFLQGCVRQRTTVLPAGSITKADFYSARDRFLSEAQTLARFQHQGIVQVYTSFEENNTAYMVMEFLKGRSLARLLESGPIALPRAVEYTLRIGEALQVVHDAGILHRDIKPDNVILTETGRIVLIDFGSARSFAGGHTRQMTAMVTPGYAPLEQYSQQARYGPYTDIYALGATLYHLLTGRLPIQPTDRVQGVELRELQELCPSATKSINDAVMWSLELQTGRRPQSVREFLGALRGSLPKRTWQTKERDSISPGPSPHPARENPYRARIQELLAVLEKPLAPPPPSLYEARIKQLQTLLDAVSQMGVPPKRKCPSCQHLKVVAVTGKANGRAIRKS
jgi:F-box protein 11